VFTRQQRRTKLVYGFVDVLLVAFAFELAYQTRLALPLYWEFFIVSPVKALLMGAACVLWPITAIWLRTYDRLDAEQRPRIMRDTTRQCVAAGVLFVVLEYALRLDLSRLFLALFVAYTWILLSLLRLNAPRLIGWLRRGFGTPYFVLVAGTSERARRIGELLESSSDFGVRLSGFLAADGSSERGTLLLNQPYPVHPLEDLQKLLNSDIVDEIIFCVDSRRLGELEEVFLTCQDVGVRTRIAVDFFPHVTGDIYLDRIHNTPLLTFTAAPHDELRLMAKRLVDVVVAGILLLLLAPFMLLIAVIIRLTSPGPAIFRQERCGLNGRRFIFYKFRSMCQEAEQMKPALAHLNEKTTAFKISNDPRVNPVGRWLRKFSIDEWPQLWNVLRGDMSLVGPRPPIPEEVRQYAGWQRRRLRMRPGLTCLWAIDGRDSLDFESWIRKDLEYIDNWSLSLDWRVIVRTIPQVLSGKGAH
jgi:exopolysaccharide biosynthesis polyprenyl glycosylphosphotransferase